MGAEERIESMALGRYPDSFVESGAVVPWRMVYVSDIVHGLNMVHGLEGLPVQRCSAGKGLGSIYEIGRAHV